MTFDDILKKYRGESFTTHSLGNKFERLMRGYLLTDPKYSERFSDVWLWNEFPYRKQFGGTDTGIDLVAATYAGQYCAIQCKFYADGTHMDKRHVDAFITTSARTFTNDEVRTTAFSERLWLSTTNSWGRNAEESIRNQSPAFERTNLSDLRNAPVDWEKLEHEVHGRAARSAQKSTRAHQRLAIETTQEYFKTRDRGKLIMACGTGKTFTSLRIAEKETEGRGLILFLVPSI